MIIEYHMNVTHKNNFFIFTGGPGAGKSTLLKALSDHGLPHIAETARAIMKERLERKLLSRPAPAEFARQIFEIDHQNYLENIEYTDILLFDRSFLDSAWMLKEADDAYFKKIKHVLNVHRYNKTVFIAPPWEEIYQNDTERDQTFSEAQRVYKKLFDWYTANDYFLIDLPKASVVERVKFVMEKIKAG